MVEASSVQLVIGTSINVLNLLPSAYLVHSVLFFGLLKFIESVQLCMPLGLDWL